MYAVFIGFIFWIPTRWLNLAVLSRKSKDKRVHPSYMLYSIGIEDEIEMIRWKRFRDAMLAVEKFGHVGFRGLYIWDVAWSVKWRSFLSLRSKRFRLVFREHFWLFSFAEIGLSAKKCKKGGGEGRKGKLAPPLAPRSFHFLRSSHFRVATDLAKNSSNSRLTDRQKTGFPKSG